MKGGKGGKGRPGAKGRDSDKQPARGGTKKGAPKRDWGAVAKETAPTPAARVPKR